MHTGGVERGRARGNWSVSPLWEAKILLGVLKEQGLAGMGLVKAFERWAPTIARSSRNDMNEVYRKQTGREMSDYILVQLADKVVRYNQLPPQADIVRQALLNSRGLSDPRVSPKVHLHIRTKSVTAHRTPGGSSQVATARANAAQIRARNSTDANLNLTALKQRLLNTHDPNVLLSTNEVASLTGFRPKTIRRWVSGKLLNYIRVGNRLRFRLAALELFLGQREIRR